MGSEISGLSAVRNNQGFHSHEHVVSSSNEDDSSYYVNSSNASGLIYTPKANAGCNYFNVVDENGENVEVCYTNGSRQAFDLREMGTAKDVDKDVMDASSKVVPSTVKLEVRGNKGQGWSGSGYILSNEVIARNFPGIEIEEDAYYIMTNHHVASDSREITVISPDRKNRFRAEIVKRNGVELMDKMADCALVKIKTNVSLPRVDVASYSDIKQGETLITAGYPLGLPNVAITKGVTSVVRQETGQPYMAIQTDAEINPGNSGGPLFTLDGKVVGTNTYSFRDTNGLSFAISTIEQLDVMSQIWSKGKVPRGDVGISFKPLDSATRYASGIPFDTTGAIIASIEPNSDASRAGVKKGDILTSIDVLDNDGNLVRTIDVNYEQSFDLTSLIGNIYSLSPDTNVRLNLLRKDVKENGAYSFINFDVSLKVSEYEPIKTTDATSWGFTAIDDEKGIVLLDVLPDSPADKQNIESGTWLISGIRSPGLKKFSTQTVRNAEELQDIMNWLDENGSTEITLYLRDYLNPSIMKRVTLTRGIDDAILAVMFKGGENLGMVS